MRTAGDRRRWAMALWTVGAVPVMTVPSIAQAGFFDFLFGPPPQAVRPYEPFPGYVHRHVVHRFHWPAHKFAARRKFILADKKRDHPMGPQAPTDIMDDDSLRRGDAVMTQAGIRIFEGYSSDHHRPEDFLKISEIKKLSQRERRALAALDSPVSNKGGQTAGKPDIVTGRSATEDQITVGETIIDPNGRTVRYVGP